jgi:hypothetical protein
VSCATKLGKTSEKVKLIDWLVAAAEPDRASLFIFSSRRTSPVP